MEEEELFDTVWLIKNHIERIEKLLAKIADDVEKLSKYMRE